MKRTTELRKFLYSASVWGYGAVSVLATFLAWLNGVESDEVWLANRPIVLAVILKVQLHTPYFYLILGGLLSLCWIIRTQGDPWVIEKIKFILNEYQRQVFGKNAKPRDHERITIFKHKRYCLLPGHWSRKSSNSKFSGRHLIGSYLVPYLRSGNLSQNTRACFYAPDDSDKAEGVASLAWARNNLVVQQNLPNLNNNSANDNKRRYANRTNCPVGMIDDYLERGRPLPRSIAAVPLERNNKLWGVLVLDSRAPDGVTDESVNNFRLTISLIEQLLERA